MGLPAPESTLKQQSSSRSSRGAFSISRAFNSPNMQTCSKIAPHVSPERKTIPSIGRGFATASSETSEGNHSLGRGLSSRRPSGNVKVLLDEGIDACTFDFNHPDSSVIPSNSPLANMTRSSNL